jgi:hypothetical protein
MMMVISFFILLLWDMKEKKAVIILLMCIYRVIDAYADVYEGAFQLDDRLDLTGKSLTFRTVCLWVYLLF